MMSRIRDMALPVLIAVLVALLLISRATPDVMIWRYALAGYPILAVLVLMAGAGWAGHRAGIAGLAFGLAVAILAFGLNGDVLWISQAKGLFLSLYVLVILWPALLLFNVVNRVGGIQAMAAGLQRLIADRGLLLVGLAWPFAATLEGLAGFGLPVAIVAPMLTGLGVPAVVAVAAPAIGHSWAVTFGNMGVVFQVLTGVVKMDGALIAPSAGILLGITALLCGLAAAHVLGQFRYWWAVLIIAAVMGGLQYVLANSGLSSLTIVLAGTAGMLTMILISRRRGQKTTVNANGPAVTPALLAGIGAYGGLALLVAIANIVPPIYEAFRQVVIQGSFPAVTSADGFVTAAGTGPAFRPLTHPGTYALLVAVVGFFLLQRAKMLPEGSGRAIARGTVRSAGPASVGVLAMVGLSAIMDHTGMSLLLGQALSAAMGGALPIISPVIGMLGAFATGSNQNSNVLFAPLQMSAAIALSLSPAVVVAAQTTGGALGAMIAPAKLIIGCSTVGATGQEGVVLRRTLPYGLLLALLVGVVALFMSRM